jgi:hypothetical protein
MAGLSADALNTEVEGRIAQHAGAGTTQRFPGRTL